MSVPVLNRLLNAQGKPRPSVAQRPRRSTGLQAPSQAPTTTTLRRRPLASHNRTFHPVDPLNPTFRANPFPKVTDLFCRLPVSTLFYRPEASNLGDLLRLWVRLDSRFIHSRKVSRDNRYAPDSPKSEELYHWSNPISRQSDSRVIAQC